MKNYLASAFATIALLVPTFPSISNAQTQLCSLRVRAYIDGSDYLYVRGNETWYEHISWKLPGKGGNNDENEPTYLNGEAWYPTWNGNGSGATSGHCTLPASCRLPTDIATTVSLANNSSRCTVSISTQPTASNDFTLKIYLYDSANGAAWCDFTLSWVVDSATPTINDISAITNVTAQQRYPWNGKVDISYIVAEDISMQGNGSGVGSSLMVTATDCAANQTYIASSLSGDMALTEGTHSLVWDMDADGLAIKSTNVVFSVLCEATSATYCVIYISAGSSASSYPVTYLAEPPSGGFNTDEYKTTKLVLRRIEPGTFLMCGQYQATLTKPYYAGVFEVTQKQYELVTEGNPSSHTGDKRPVERVSYNTIRGANLGTQWPSSSVVDSDSFMGKLRMRTGLEFDLPTEAQWEYACRAGTLSNYNCGGDTENNLQKVGRYSGNTSDGKGGFTDAHTTVGSYLPNAWGLYDMHGNVWEWCLDWSGSLSSPLSDPKGSSSGSRRVQRGGGWVNRASVCASSYRDNASPTGQDENGGFRLALITDKISYAGTSQPTEIDLNSGMRVAMERESIRYSSEWNGSESVTLSLDGTILTNVTGSGSLTIDTSDWLRGKQYVLSHSDGVETLTATFEKGPQLLIACSSNHVVSISADEPDVTIYYSLDGTPPTTDSAQYTSPFVLDGDAIIQALAVRSGGAVAASNEKVVGQDFIGDDFVRDVHGRQRYPWNGLVDIGLSIVGDNDLEYDVHVKGLDSASGTNLLVSSLSELRGATTNSTIVVAGPGMHDIVWNADRDMGGGFKSTVELDVFAVPRYYTVRYLSNGGSGTMANQHIFHGKERALRPNVFSRTGYSFSGWSRTANGQGEYANSASVIDLTSVNGSVVPLYAVWSPNHYSVSFNANGGSGSMSNQGFTYGVSQNLSPNRFSRSGYTFQGWGTSSSGGVVYANSASVSNLSSSNNGVVQLFAIWKADTPSAPSELYLVIDVSGGSSAQSYPVTQMSSIPSGGWSDAYKTTKIVLRRIPAGSFNMGNLSYLTTLSKPFYIGVFEITQKQYQLVMGSNPAYSKGDMRPVEFVSYDMIRGSDDGSKWPTSSAVDSDSFLGKLRAKTGIDLDIPTEAQWEYACRTGTTSNYNNGGDEVDDLKLLGRYTGNSSDGKGGYTYGTTKVGSYEPNAWGLYDMHGNVCEWCLDRYASSLTGGTDPKGPLSGSISRLSRGGADISTANQCTSSDRRQQNPSVCDRHDGFRLAYHCK